MPATRYTPPETDLLGPALRINENRSLKSILELARADVGMAGMSPARKPHPSDMSDEAWALVAPSLRLPREDAGRRAHSLREVCDGPRDVLRSGCSRRLVSRDLTPCAPDFHPIEMAFSKRKALLRKAAERPVAGECSAIGRLIDTLTPDACAAAGHNPDQAETAITSLFRSCS